MYDMISTVISDAAKIPAVECEMMIGNLFPPLFGLFQNFELGLMRETHDRMNSW